jgi:hypothetical protein
MFGNNREELRLSGEDGQRSHFTAQNVGQMATGLNIDSGFGKTEEVWSSIRMADGRAFALVPTAVTLRVGSFVDRSANGSETPNLEFGVFRNSDTESGKPFLYENTEH